MGALLVSLVGATVAMSVRHKTSNNWHPNLSDAWFYILSGSVSVTLVLLGYDTASILAATTGINTPIAILQTAIEKRNGVPKLTSASLAEIQAEVTSRKLAVV